MIELQYSAGGHNNGARQHKRNGRRDDGVRAMVLMIRVASRTRLPNDDVRRKERAEQRHDVLRVLGARLHSWHEDVVQ